jgi:mycobactin salicyl-AMP ligase
LVARAALILHHGTPDSIRKSYAGTIIMSALAAAAMPKHHEPDSVEATWAAMRLSGLLGATADRHASRAAFTDQPGRDEWSGRPSIEWAYPAAYNVVERLSQFFVQMRLPPKSPIGICLPNGSEACLTLLAVEHAGLIPCLLPVAWPEDDLAAAVEAANLAAVVTQGTVGDERPAEMFRGLALRYFGLRFIAAYGPGVPDGVTDLDKVILGAEGLDARATASAEPMAENGIVTFWRQGGRIRPVFRPCQSVVAAAVTFLVAAKVRSGDRIMSLIAPDDHCGLTTGLIASLLSGATLECHGLFKARPFVEALEEPKPTHLVVPAWMETTLARATLPETVVSVILVHEAPARFKAKTVLKTPAIDVLAFGELAVVAAPRRDSGQFALSLDDTGHGNVTTRHLMRIRRDPDGAIEFGGLATDIHDYGRGALRAPRARPEWRRSGFKSELFAGILIGVTEED